MSRMNKIEFRTNDLSELKEMIVRKNAIDMFDSGAYDKLEVGTIDSLVAIHKYLYDGVCKELGIMELKKHDGVPKHSLKPTYELLYDRDKKPMETFEEVIAKFAYFTASFPFEDGNGRCARIWLELVLLKKFGKYPIWRNLMRPLDSKFVMIDGIFTDGDTSAYAVEKVLVPATKITREMFIDNLKVSFAMKDTNY